jgi:hypothetical protein
MRLLSVLTLVLVLPWTGVRMVCLDADHDEAGAVARVQAARTDSASCAHQCPAHARPAPPRATRCFFVSDDSCAYVLDGVAAVLQRGVDLTIAPVSTPMDSRPATGAYLAPVLPPPGPPPKV